MFFNGRSITGALAGPFYDYAIIIEKAHLKRTHLSPGPTALRRSAASSLPAGR
jgi:hypothetical protein